MNTTTENPLKVMVHEIIYEHLELKIGLKKEKWDISGWSDKDRGDYFYLLKRTADMCSDQDVVVEKQRWRKGWTLEHLVSRYVQRAKILIARGDTDRGKTFAFDRNCWSCRHPEDQELWKVEPFLLDILEEWMRDKPRCEIFERFIARRRLLLIEWATAEETENEADLIELDTFPSLRRARCRYHKSRLSGHYFEKLFGLAKSSDDWFFVVKHTRRNRDLWNRAVVNLARQLVEEQSKE